MKIAVEAREVSPSELRVKIHIQDFLHRVSVFQSTFACREAFAKFCEILQDGCWRKDDEFELFGPSSFSGEAGWYLGRGIDRKAVETPWMPGPHEKLMTGIAGKYAAAEAARLDKELYDAAEMEDGPIKNGDLLYCPKCSCLLEIQVIKNPVRLAEQRTIVCTNCKYCWELPMRTAEEMPCDAR